MKKGKVIILLLIILVVFIYFLVIQEEDYVIVDLEKYTLDCHKSLKMKNPTIITKIASITNRIFLFLNILIML